MVSFDGGVHDESNHNQCLQVPQAANNRRLYVSICTANAPMKMPAVVAAVDTAVVVVVVATEGVAGVGVADAVGGTTTRRKKLRSKS